MELFGSSTHTLTHTRTQHIRFQSINIAYTQRAPWHKKDAATGDKQTNKRNQTKATLAQFINLSKAQMQKQGEQVERGGEATHLDKLNVLKKKWINISQQPKPRRWRASLAAPVFVSLQGQLCAALLHFSSPPLFPSCPRLTYVNIWACYSSSACPRAACEKWIGFFTNVLTPAHNISGHTQVAISQQSCNSTPLSPILSPPPGKINLLMRTQAAPFYLEKSNSRESEKNINKNVAKNALRLAIV